MGCLEGQLGKASILRGLGSHPVVQPSPPFAQGGVLWGRAAVDTDKAPGGLAGILAQLHARLTMLSMWQLDQEVGNWPLCMMAIVWYMVTLRPNDIAGHQHHSEDGRDSVRANVGQDADSEMLLPHTTFQPDEQKMVSDT